MYNIEWTKEALEELDKLEPIISKRILKKLDLLLENPYTHDVKKLKGMEGFRLRVGDYRVIFKIDRGIILILKVGHRKNIYDF